MPAEQKQPPAVIAAAFANPVDQQLVTGFLAGLGYQPVAFSADRVPKADLFILDAPSARRFGEPVLERKRATEIFLPAIIALGQDAPVDPWLAAGFDDSLRLPFTKAELARRVEILLRVRRQSQALAQSAEARYQALFENAPVGIGVSDQQGRLLLFNQAMLAPGGYTPEDIEQIESVADLYYDPQQRQVALEEFRAEGRVVDFRVQFKRKDGTPYDAVLSFTPITYQGKPCIQAIVQDITDRVQAEQALREAHDRLEERVRERTAELQRMVNLMAGREIRMAELKQAIRQLRAQLQEAGLTPVADDPLRAGLEE